MQLQTHQEYELADQFQFRPDTDLVKNTFAISFSIKTLDTKKLKIKFLYLFKE